MGSNAGCQTTTLTFDHDNTEGCGWRRRLAKRVQGIIRCEMQRNLHATPIERLPQPMRSRAHVVPKTRLFARTLPAGFEFSRVFTGALRHPPRTCSRLKCLSLSCCNRLCSSAIVSLKYINSDLTTLLDSIIKLIT